MFFIESGVDFEKRIVQIYNNCRTEAEINTAFDVLQKELEDSINQRLEQTHQQLMENFDEEVLEKKLADKRLHLHAEEDNIESRKNVFLDDIEKKISTHIEQTTLFVMRWQIV